MFRIYAAPLNDVDVENWPVATDATITENVLKEGKKFTYVDSTSSSINPSAAPGESPLNGILTLTPNIEGISPQSLQWIYENVGEDFVVVWVRCIDNQKFIGGSPCSSGLRLTYTNIGALDGGIGGIALQFQGQECPEPFYFYNPTEFPVEEDTPSNP
ncbi:hypothetical protein [Paludibacter sp. 221]|uniref:hypothetical protein n=1 Tax=Paludibacter sp. 221 TaxID=2302939 RepID=UPI0013D853C3|nr:hypothetical protein [Paludibacter sp. 221]